MSGATCPGRKGRPCGAPKSTAERWCPDCRVNKFSDLLVDGPPYLAPGAPVAAEIGPVRPPGPSAPDEPAIGLTATYARALEKMGRADSPEGTLVIQLASMLEFGLAETLSARASMAGRLMSAWEAATAGAKPEVDVLDEISKRRKEKFG